jgi:hypothetical protein
MMSAEGIVCELLEKHDLYVIEHNEPKRAVFKASKKILAQKPNDPYDLEKPKVVNSTRTTRTQRTTRFDRY